MSFRDRIKELRRVPAASLVPHPLNWRRHGERQASAVRELLDDVSTTGRTIREALALLHGAGLSARVVVGVSW